MVVDDGTVVCKKNVYICAKFGAFTTKCSISAGLRRVYNAYVLRARQNLNVRGWEYSNGASIAMVAK